MSASIKTPRKTPHKQRNILEQDDEKKLDETIETKEEKQKIVAAQRSRRKSTLVHRNVSDEIISSDNEIEKPTKKKSVKKSKTPTISEDGLSPTGWVEDSSDSRKSTKKQDLEKTPTKIVPKKLRHRTPSSKALENVAANSSPSELKNTRKSLRVRSPRKRLIEGETAKSNKKVDSSSTSDISGFVECSSDPASDSNDLEKPSTLFGDGDVEGQNFFGFKTPKKSDGMLAMAARTPKRDKSCPNPKTPHHLRVKTKKRKFKKNFLENFILIFLYFPTRTC